MNQHQIVPPDIGFKGKADISSRILHLLKIYPVISPSMLQLGIGSSIPGSIWKPILRELIDEEAVKEDIFVSMSASGRHQSYTLISLKDTPIYFPNTK